MSSLTRDEQKVVSMILEDSEPTRAVDLTSDSWESWSQWVESNLHVAQKLFDGMRNKGVSRQQALDAVLKWVADSGDSIWTLESQALSDGSAGAKLKLNGGLPGDEPIAIIDLGIPDPEGVGQVDEDTLMKTFAQVERHFLLCDPEAPLMVITYQEQVDIDDLSPPETRNIQWVSAQTLHETPVRQRDSLMEKDTYESDELRDDPGAPESVSEWEGMFWCQGGLYRAGKEIQAARQSMRMDEALPKPRNNQIGKPRM